MTITLRTAGLALLLAGFGCTAHRSTGASTSSTAAPAAPVPQARADAGDAAGACPMDVPGTQVSVADTQDGAAVTFTSTPDREADVRARVHAMAALHDHEHQGAGTGHAAMDDDAMHGEAMHGEGMHDDAVADDDDMSDDAMQQGMREGGATQDGSTGSGAAAAGDEPMMPPPSRAVVDDVPGGARLVVTPEDPAQVDRLRSAVRMHAQRMQETRSCGHPGAHGDR